MVADEVMVHFHILAGGVNGLNNIAISPFLHSLQEGAGYLK